MAFTPNIPAATDKISTSQPQIQANFNALVPFSEGYANLNVLAGAPTWTAGYNGIYNLLNADTTKNELYVHHQTNDAPTDVPFTASKMSNTAMASCLSGWAYLSNGMLIKWGTAGFTSGSTVDINPKTISGGPDFSYPLQVFLTKSCASAQLTAGYDIALNGFLAPGSTTGEFRVNGVNTAAGCSVKYLVIGV